MNTTESNKSFGEDILKRDPERRGEGPGRDREGRKIDYLRISVTDRCNLRCRYCMPEGARLSERDDLLSFEETEVIVRAFSEEGISKLKITGGEPLLRHNCPELIRRLKAIKGIEEISITTNGVMLCKYLDEIREAGVGAVNISLDTLNREKYREITGFDKLPEVLNSIEASLSAGLGTKINVAVMKGVNTSDEELSALMELARDRELCVRFIEMMPIGCGTGYDSYDNAEILRFAENKYCGVSFDGEKHGNGPAEYYKIEGFKGRIGFISAVHHKFCDKCNRLRLTSTGELKYCLCYEDGIDLREILRRSGENSAEKMRDLKEAFRTALSKKPKEHCFDDMKKISEHKKMFQIGG